MPPKLDEEQEDYVLLLKQLLRVALKHIQQLQQGSQSGCEGPYFPDSLPLSALEQVFVMTWQSYEASPALSMKRVVKEVAAELGGSAPDLYVRPHFATCLCCGMCMFSKPCGSSCFVHGDSNCSGNCSWCFRACLFGCLATQYCSRTEEHINRLMSSS